MNRGFLLVAYALGIGACSNKLVTDDPRTRAGSTGTHGEDAGDSSSTGGVTGVIVVNMDARFEPDRPCTGILCSFNQCEGKTKTSIKGTVYDPAGVNPLYNVMVYVPSTELDVIVDGPNCQRCDGTASGRPIATALSDSSGNFVIENAPSGPEIPVVVQTGKWRRKIVLPDVKPCQQNEFTDKNTFRLPRDKSEGHLPKIAMTLGKADCIECLMRRMGIADAEFTNPEGPGRINLFHESGVSTAYAAGTPFPSVTSLWNSVESMSRYDLVILSCHGEFKNRARPQPTAVKEVVKGYVDKGGRVFASHFFASFFRGVPGTYEATNFQSTPFPLAATGWDGDGSSPFDIEMGFPKGLAFADWLVTVGASQTKGSIELSGVENPAEGLDATIAQRWIYKKGGDSFPYFSLAMPVEKAATPDEQCGRFVHTGIHVSGEKDAEKPFPFPTACRQGKLSPQELALEFLIFDLSACMLRNDQTPTPPPIIY